MHFISFGRTSVLIAAALRCTVGLLCAGVLATGASAWADDEPAPWKKAEAGQYLDERAKAWLAFTSADRGEGETMTSCISCHTFGPYALAMPALRKLTGASEPTEYESKLLAQTKLRVENWEKLDSPRFRLLYDFNEAKKKQSWGTEAVINAVVLAFDDNYAGRRLPNDATRRALANLWQAQASDGDQQGSWEWLDFGLEPWEAGGARYFGAALAAVAVGTVPGYYTSGADAELDRRVTLLRDYLKHHRAQQNLFNRVWLLWPSNAIDGLLTREEQTAVVGELLEAQQADGGWRLASLGAFARDDGTPQETASDGFATGFVLHVLQTVGVAGNESQIARGLDWLCANQAPTGEWRASSVNKQRDPATHVGRFMADAATAYAVLALSH